MIIYGNTGKEGIFKANAEQPLYEPKRMKFGVYNVLRSDGRVFDDELAAASIIKFKNETHYTVWDIAEQIRRAMCENTRVFGFKWECVPKVPEEKLEYTPHLNKVKMVGKSRAERCPDADRPVVREDGRFYDNATEAAKDLIAEGKTLTVVIHDVADLIKSCCKRTEARGKQSKTCGVAFRWGDKHGIL